MRPLRTDGGFYFPSLRLYYSPIEKNASTSTMSRLVREEERRGQPAHDLPGVTRYVPIPDNLVVNAWNNYASLTKSYLVGSIDEYMERAEHRLAILRNPVKRLVSGWVNKFFMQRSAFGDSAAASTPRSGAEIVDAFNAFVHSLSELSTETFHADLDGHVLPQSAFISSLDAYTMIAGVGDIESVYRQLGLDPQAAARTPERAARLNTSPEEIIQLITAHADLELIRTLYQRDYQLIQAASAQFPNLKSELDHVQPNVDQKPIQVSDEVCQSLIQKRIKYQNDLRESTRLRKSARPKPPIPVAIYLLCHNERVLLPHTVEHYRSRIPQAAITILDNESTDGSVEIAQSLGCRVRSWASENQIDDHLYVTLKNEAWKHHRDGWVIVADMDEWLCITSIELKQAAARGITVLRTSGWNIVGESTREDLSDLDLHALNTGRHLRSRDKLVAFRPDAITAMNYGIGAHVSATRGRVVLSPRIYLLKHMERLGTPWLRAKFIARTARAERMHAMGIALHYTSNIEDIDQRQASSVAAARPIPVHTFAATQKRRVLYVLQLVRHRFSTLRSSPDVRSKRAGRRRGAE
jgi:glycosyltransferase involved in cell wall biosynthesis